MRLPTFLRKIADWDVRLELVAIAAIFIAGLVLILFEHCASTNAAAAILNHVPDRGLSTADPRRGS